MLSRVTTAVPRIWSAREWCVIDCEHRKMQQRLDSFLAVWYVRYDWSSLICCAGLCAVVLLHLTMISEVSTEDSEESEDRKLMVWKIGSPWRMKDYVIAHNFTAPTRKSRKVLSSSPPSKYVGAMWVVVYLVISCWPYTSMKHCLTFSSLVR